MRDGLELPVDVAIATPDSLLRYRHSEQVKLTDVRHLVIDEADAMFDESFRNSTLSILQSVQVRGVCVRVRGVCAGEECACASEGCVCR